MRVSWHIDSMWKPVLTSLFIAALPLSAIADQQQRLYKWTDADGNVFWSDKIPPEYADRPKQVVNEHGVTVAELEGKKTAEQIEQERIENEKRAAAELQRRADQALLATYLSVDEILMHRDRRVELFKAQSKVTELYLRNLERRLDSLMDEASQYSPYSTDPDAPMINDELAADLRTTRTTIERHQANLQKFRDDEEQIIQRFDGDIVRFKALKGIDQ